MKDMLVVSLWALLVFGNSICLEADSWTLVVQEDSEMVSGTINKILADSGANPQHIDEVFEEEGFVAAVLQGISTTVATRISRDPRVLLIERNDERNFKFPESYYPDNPAALAWWPHKKITHELGRLDGRIEFFWSQDISYPSCTFVVDSGINRSDNHIHWDRVYDALRGSGDDCDNHGTHVAGIISHYGAEHFRGLIPNNSLQIVRVLPCNEPIPPEFVFDGFMHVLRTVRALRKNSTGARPQPVVMNLSLGPGFSKAETVLLNKLHDEGVIVVAAAGNNSIDACEIFEPDLKAIIVGSIDKDDEVSSFSNHGPCVDIYAPGNQILSRGRDDLRRPLAMSGTSMAAPHVTASAAALAGALYRCSERGRKGIPNDEEGKRSCQGYSYFEYVKDVLERSSRKVPQQGTGEEISVLYVGPKMDTYPLRRQDFLSD